MGAMRKILIAILLIPVAVALTMLSGWDGPDKAISKILHPDGEPLGGIINSEGHFESEVIPGMTKGQLDELMNYKAEFKGPDGTVYSSEINVNEYKKGKYVAKVKGHSLLKVFKNQPPVHWDTANAIPWYSDTTTLSKKETQKQLKILKKSFQIWSKASKGAYLFKYAGETKAPLKHKASTQEPLLDTTNSGLTITFVKPQYANGNYTYNNFGNTIAYAGPTFFENYKITKASMVANKNYVKTYTPNRIKAVYVHEIGHALGLSHVTDKRSVMYHTEQGGLHLSQKDKKAIQYLSGLK